MSLASGVARRLRIQFGGALYHIINRGNYRRNVVAPVGAAQAFETSLRPANGKRAMASILGDSHSAGGQHGVGVMSPDPSLTPSFSVIDVSIMKNRTATVADLRNHFRRVSAWLENGESVEIIKRGRRFARLIPASAEATPNKPVKIDFIRQLRSVWGKKVFSDAEVQAMRGAELGSES
jgi:antitoxin (DNA-binding transcriptional repressor) of toxin-antitoxin stability system